VKSGRKFLGKKRKIFERRGRRMKRKKQAEKNTGSWAAAYEGFRL